MRLLDRMRRGMAPTLASQVISGVMVSWLCAYAAAAEVVGEDPIAEPTTREAAAVSLTLMATKKIEQWEAEGRPSRYSQTEIDITRLLIDASQGAEVCNLSVVEYFRSRHSVALASHDGRGPLLGLNGEGGVSVKGFAVGLYALKGSLSAAYEYSRLTADPNAMADLWVMFPGVKWGDDPALRDYCIWALSNHDVATAIAFHASGRQEDGISSYSAQEFYNIIDLRRRFSGSALLDQYYMFYPITAGSPFLQYERWNKLIDQWPAKYPNVQAPPNTAEYLIGHRELIPALYADKFDMLVRASFAPATVERYESKLADLSGKVGD